MNKLEPDPSDQQIKALLGSHTVLSNQAVEKQRRATIHRARASVAQRDTILFAFVKMWTALADIFAPLFATFAAKRNIVEKPTKINKSLKK